MSMNAAKQEPRRYQYEHHAPSEIGPSGDLSLPEALQACFIESTSGILRVRNSDLEKHIYILDGIPVFVQSDLRTETLGQFLKRTGRISHDDHRLLMETMRQSGKRQGDLLVSLDILETHEVFDAMREHVMEKVITCFAWDRCELSLAEGDAWRSDTPNLAMDVYRTILEGVSRYYGRERLMPLSIISGQCIPFVREDKEELLQSVKLTTQEAHIVGFVKGKKAIDEIAWRMGGDKIATYRVLHALYLLEVLGFEETVEPPSFTWDRSLLQEVAETPRAEPSPENKGETLLADYLKLIDADYYAFFGIEKDATTKEIVAAFKVSSKKYKPEAHAISSADVKEKAAELYMKAVKGYRTLKAPTSRKQYTSELGHPEVAQVAEVQPQPARAEKADEKKARISEEEELFEEAKKRSREGDYRKSEVLLTKALERSPGEPLYRTWRAWAAYQQDPKRNRDRVEIALELSRRDNPEIPETYLFMCRIYVDDEDYERAGELFEAAMLDALVETHLAS